MKVLDAQHPLAQRHILLQRPGVGAGGGDQVVVNFFRDKVAGERGRPGAGIAAAFGQIGVGFSAYRILMERMPDEIRGTRLVMEHDLSLIHI